jgi:putative CocE/NonD family hydrolase
MFNLTIEVPMRDGTILRGLHHSPRSSPAPVVFSVTPYGAQRLHPRGGTFAKRGYHFVGLDSRGRGDSDGEFIPLENEAADGHDAVEWLARQPWSTGEVVMYGGSYCGFAVWAIAATRPAGLRAISPYAAVYPGGDFPMERGVPLNYAVQWLTLVHARRANHVVFDDSELWAEASREQIRRGASLRELDLIAIGERLPAFQKWLNHPEFDDYWAGLVPSERQYRNITMPVLTITGQYDDDQLGALRYHAEHVAAAGEERHHVVIGPWDHAGTGTGARSFGGLTFAESSAIDLLALQADWYDWVLGRAGRPAFLTDRVVYFHVGEDTWRSALRIPQGQQEIRLHLTASRTSPGGLSAAQPVTPQAIELHLDPLLADGSTRDLPANDTKYTDARLLVEPDAAVIVQVSEPLTNPVDITGRFRLDLTLSSQLPDFDLMASVYLLRDKDNATQISKTLFRARYRSSPREASAWPAGEAVPVTLAGFSLVSRRTTPGDRIALVIHPPYREFQVNYQGGGIASDETARDVVAGTVTILAGSLVIPVIPEN